MKKRNLFTLSMCAVITFAMAGCSSGSTEQQTMSSEVTTEVKSSQEETTTEEKSTEKRTLSDAAQSVLDKYETKNETIGESSSEPETTTITSSNIDVTKYKDIFMPDSMRFGMAAAEIKDTETRYKRSNPTSGKTEWIGYRGTKDSYYEMVVECVYCCVDNKLTSFWCEFDKESYKIESYYELYQEVKESITERYGECATEEIVWTDDTYKDDKSKWDKAFEYGYVTINTRFEISNDKVILVRWDYNNYGLMVITTTKDNEKNL